jgi:hypothetical protein
MSTRHAACSCEQLRLTVEGEPVRVSICHCLACQRRTGSVFGVQARFDAEQVTIERASRQYVRVSDEGERRAFFHFCPNWPLAATTRMMNEHLKLTTNEAVARLKGNWKADIAAYDNVRAEILMMSDTLADGIIRQFPIRFA